MLRRVHLLISRPTTHVLLAVIVSLSARVAFAQQPPACPAGTVPAPVMPDATSRSGPPKTKCVTPQEAMELAVAMQAELLKKMMSGAQQDSQAPESNPMAAMAATLSRAGSSATTAPAKSESGDPGPAIAALASSGSIETSLATGRMILRGVQFSPDGSSVTSPDAESLARLARVIAASKQLYAVEAHVPANGARWGDVRMLSQKQADGFKAALVKAGAPESAVAAVGYGAGRPEKPGDTKSRIEIVRLQ